MIMAAGGGTVRHTLHRLSDKKERKQYIMKTENRKAKRRTERYSLSEIIGTRRGGFYDGCAYEIRDLVPQGGSFRLRNGTLEAFTLDSDVKFSGSVNNNGSITGYISEANLLYELHGINDVGDASEARYVSDGEIDADSTFFFTLGGSTYMMTSGRMCKRNGTDFEDFDSFEALIDAELRGGALSEGECDRATNRFSGVMAARMTVDADCSSIVLERAPSEVYRVTVNGTEIEDHSLSGGTVTVGLDLYAGDELCIYARYPGYSLSSLGLIGGSGELGGRTYLYSEGAMYRISGHGGALFCSAPVLTLPEGGMKRAFFCSGTLVLAIGEGLCVFDEEDGTLRTIGGDGAQSASSICPCGGFAFVASDGYLTRLAISGSGESETLQTVTVKDIFDYGMRGRILGMAYLRADRSLWTLTESEGGNRIFVLDVDSGIWLEVSCFDSPTAVVDCGNCIAVVCGGTVYYSSPKLSGDERGDERHPISGTIVFNPDDLGDPFAKKRIGTLEIKVSEGITEIRAELKTDVGREFSARIEKEYGEAAEVLLRPSLGLFRHVSASIGVKGYGQAALCGAALDVRSK